MGFIRRAVGRFTIETRSESFYIHADYGYRPGTRMLRDLPLDAEFFAEAPGTGRRGPWVVTVLTREYVTGAPIGPKALFPVRFDPDTLVEVPDYQVESDHPLGRLWRDHPHPEIEYADLDDLIAALVEVRDERGA